MCSANLKSKKKLLIIEGWDLFEEINLQSCFTLCVKFRTLWKKCAFSGDGEFIVAGIIKFLWKPFFLKFITHRHERIKYV